MKRAIYFRLIVLTLAAICVCALCSATIFVVSTENQTKEWLTKLTLATAENYKYNTDVEALSKAAGGNRVTVISSDGTVIADSDSDEFAVEFDNHSDREEVRFAKSGSVYIAMRKSSTLSKRFMYGSIVAGDGNILRLAYNYSGFRHNLLVQIPAIMTAVSVSLILSLYLAGILAKAVTNPLEKVVDALSAHDYDALREYKSPYYEIDKMMQSLQELLRQINDTNKKLQGEREKVGYILSNMAEGFVHVDSGLNILLCNNSAKEFFGGSNEPQNIYNLTRNQTVLNALHNAVGNGQSTSFDTKLAKGVFANVYVSPSKTAENERGATILIVDMTEQKRLLQQKRDFFSNASHELKTPITSILGFSEMLGKNMVKNEEEKAEIIRRIETESKRMSALINDILAISKLESGGEQREYTDFNLSDVIKEAANAVLPVKDGIAVNIDAEDVVYRAERRQIYDLCVNLIENAVKYNRPGGNVDISLKNGHNEVILCVSDTGIGIPEEYQGRVFERFFRVDSGRDKKIGGTGLGLSIVKHIVGIYGGKISLLSKNSGTEIVITLPA